jgi:hypothetical protein
MRLGITSDTAPQFTLDELVRSCAHRGLAALELVEGHGHGIGAGTTLARARAVRALLTETGVRHAVYRPAASRDALSAATADLAGSLGADVLVDAAAALSDIGRLERAARRFEAVGAGLVVVQPPDMTPSARRAAMEAIASVALPPSTGPGSVGTGLALDPDAGDLAAAAPAAPHAGSALLRYIRLPGSGPEAAASEGKGIGALIARLTLAGYRGSIMLAPTSHRTLPVWRVWLGRTSGWGCGSKESDPSLVQLGTLTPAAEGTA